MAHSAQEGSVPTETLSALIATLEKAGAGSRELDEKVAVATTHPYGVDAIDWDGFPAYTTSLDAALALAERVHPGFHAALYTSDGGKSRQAMITVPSRTDGPFTATAATIPLALCIAILKAQASNPSGGRE